MTNWATCYFLLNFHLVGIVNSIRSFNQGVTDVLGIHVFVWFPSLYYGELSLTFSNQHLTEMAR